METHNPIRVLIVDDSRIFRSALQSVLEEIPDVEVIGSVFSGEKALEFIQASPPDLVTLDVQMPGMSGLDTLREIQKGNRDRAPFPPIDTLLVSALTNTGSKVAVEGLQLGALDFIPKPFESNEQTNRTLLKNSLVEKLTAFRQRRLGIRYSKPFDSAGGAPRKSNLSRVQGNFRALAIGTSTGGPEALGYLLPSLASRCQAPIFIVQHILAGLSQYLAESLSRKCGRSVLEAREDLLVQPGGIYLSMSGKHMLVRTHEGSVKLGISDSPPEKGCKPSVDVFLRSAASVYGGNLVSAILTGMGNDGAVGVLAVKRAGGYVVAQDEASSVVWGMPGAAVATGVVDEILPLAGIADCLVGLFTTKTSL